MGQGEMQEKNEGRELSVLTRMLITEKKEKESVKETEKERVMAKKTKVMWEVLLLWICLTKVFFLLVLGVFLPTFVYFLFLSFEAFSCRIWRWTYVSTM